MADTDTEKDDEPGPDATVPGGAYITGGQAKKDGKHYGGRITNAEGEVLAEFGDNEVNPGRHHKFKVDHEGRPVPLAKQKPEAKVEPLRSTPVPPPAATIPPGQPPK